MKNLFKAILLGVLIGNTAIAGVAPTNSNSQDGTSLKTHSNITVPNSQMTDLGGLDALIETGNKNVLKNASFEHKVFDTNWTLLGSATDAVEASTVIDGKKAANINITASGDGIAASITPIVNTLNQQMEASCKVNTSMTNIQLCATAGGVEQSCQSVPATGSYQAVSANFQGPVNGTAVGVKIKSTSAGTGAVYVDDCYVGPARNLSQVSQAQSIGSISIIGCASNWTSTAGTMTNFSAVTGCTVSPSGAIASAGMIPGGTLSNAAPGTYRVVVTGTISKQTATDAGATVALSDGTTTSNPQQIYVSTNNNYAAPFTLEQDFTYTTPQSSLTFQVKGNSGTSSSQVTVLANTAVGLRMMVYYFPSAGSGTTALTSSNNVASWSGYLNVTSGSWQTTSTTFADFSAATGTSLTQTQNRNFGTVAAASPLIPGITFTPPRAGNYFVCANPIVYMGGTTSVTFGQLQLTDGTTSIANGEVRNNANNSANGGGTITLCGVYNAASVAPVTLKVQGLTVNAAYGLGIAPSGGSAKAIGWSIVALDGMGGPVILPTTASSGVTNYLTGGDGESGASVCTPYADALGVAPVDGVGGSPSVTCSLSSSSPISGTQSYVLTKPAQNTKGQGYAFPFTIDQAGQAKLLQVSFDYQVSSNYFVGSDTSNPDLVAYVYGPIDGTPQLTQLAPYKVLGGTGTLKFQGNFQTDASGTSYRLILHETNPGVFAETVKVDNIVVSPVLRQFGTPVTDSPVIAGAPTLTITATTTAPTKGTTVTDYIAYNRIGDKAHIIGGYFQTSAGGIGSGDYLISLPTGLSFDSTKVNFYTTPIGAGTDRSTSSLGTVSITDGSAQGTGYIVPYDATHFRIAAIESTGTTSGRGIFSSNWFSLNNSVVNFSFEFTAPIQGWTSSTQMSDQSGDNRIITARATLDATPWNVANNTTTLVTFDDSTVAPNFDSVGAYNSSTGKYTFNSAGYYHVYSYIQTASATGNGIIWLYKNGAIDTWGDYSAGSYAYGFTVDTIVKAVAGDYIQIYFNQNSGGNVNIGGGRSYFTVQKLQGNQQVAASETVSAKYYATANGTANSTTPFNFDGKIYDSHNAVTTGAGWKFTAPSPGKYSLKMLFNNGGAVSGTGYPTIYKNGSAQDLIGMFTSSITVGIATGEIQLNTGEYLDIRTTSTPFTWQGGSYPTGNPSWITISKVAN